MRQLRPAVPEIGYSGGVLAAAGIVATLVLEPAPRTGHLIGAAIFFVLGTAMLMVPVTRRLREGAPSADGETVGPPVFLLAVQLVFVAAGALFVVASGYELSIFGLLIASLGLAQLAFAARLWRIERELGRRVLMRPVYRVTSERGLGHGWFDAANFVTAPSPRN